MVKYKAVKVNGQKMDLHRLIVERRIGRKLFFNEVVHHVDGDPSNNNSDNLVVMSRSEHSSLHMGGRSLSDKTKNALRISAIKNLNSAKIQVSKVIEIKRWIIIGSLSNKEISKICGVTPYKVSQIRQGRIWKWVQI